MFSRYLGWFQAWRQPRLTGGYTPVDGQDLQQFSQEDSQAIAGIDQSTRSQKSGVSRSPKGHHPDVRNANNGGREQSLDKYQHHTCNPSKGAVNSPTLGPNSMPFRDLAINHASSGSSSPVNSLWSTAAQDGDHSEGQLTPNIKHNLFATQQSFECNKGRRGVLVSQEQRPIMAGQPHLNIKADRGRSFVKSDLDRNIPLTDQDSRVREEGRSERRVYFMTLEWTSTATAGRRNRVRKESKVSPRTTSGRPRTSDDQTHLTVGVPLHNTKRDIKKATGTIKQALSDLAQLPREDRKKIVAEIAKRQNAARATKDRRYENFRRRYTEPWDLVRETRSKAAEEMIKAAKAEALQKSANNDKDPNTTASAERISSQGPPSEDGKTASSVPSSPCKPAIGAHGAKTEHNQGTDGPDVLRKDNSQAEGAMKGAIRSGDTNVPVAGASVERPQKQASIPWPRLYDARDKAAGKIFRGTRVKTYSRPAYKPKVPDIDEPEIEPDPVEDPPKRQWKASDPALDPDSLIVRYAQLESVKVPELDREESRRLFKAKQEQLRKQRARNWWEKDEDAPAEDRWQRFFARERHPGEDASTDELHEHYRMVHQTVLPPRRPEHRMTGEGDLKYNKKRTPPVPTLEESSKAMKAICR